MIKFSIFQNDPLYRMLSKLGLIGEDGRPKVFQTIIFFSLITWLIPAILAYFQGVAIGASPATSYLYDFAAYAQFLITIPFLIAGESYIDEEIEYGINHLFISNILPKHDRRDFEKNLRTASIKQAHLLPMIIAIGIALIAGAIYWYAEVTNGISNWHSIVPISYVLGQFENPTLAGWWNALISEPILIYFNLRWAWKIIVWYWVLWKMSQQKLQLHATHPDQFGGLGFLSNIQNRFFILILADGLAIAATNAYKTLIEGEKMSVVSLSGLAAIAFAIAAPMIFLAPLLLFNPALSNAKRNSLIKCSVMATKYCSNVEILLTSYQNNISSEKSVKDIHTFNKKYSSEIKKVFKNLSSIHDYYEKIYKMHSIPIDIQKSGRLFISGIGPIIPPFFTAFYELILKVH